MARKKYRKKLRKELRQAYADLDSKEIRMLTTVEQDGNEMHRAIGRYYGLRTAYALLTGLPEDAVGQEVVSWYVRSEHYERPDRIVPEPGLMSE